MTLAIWPMVLVDATVGAILFVRCDIEKICSRGIHIRFVQRLGL